MWGRGDLIEVARIAVLSDNYVWLVHDDESGETVVVDPAVVEFVIDAADARGWTITHIWNTHWHPDHTDGNLGIKARTGCRIIGPSDPDHPLAGLDEVANGGGKLCVGPYSVEVMETPGHTSVHLCYHIPSAGVIFTGDTLFAMGCGRLFEGTAEQMYDNMQALSALPGDTLVYCAHEYTLTNGLFARTAEPGNAQIARRVAEIEDLRARNVPTIPTTIAQELATNPFLRAQSVAQFRERRSARDVFKV
jgi:hydroxyacylglutathione hydrolase